MPTIVSLVPPLLIFICLYAGIAKFAARLLRYTLSWKRSFVFALAMLIIAMASRALQFAIGRSLPLWLALIFLLAAYLALGASLFAEGATNASGQVLGWRGGLRLAACAFLVMAVFALLLVGVSFFLHSFQHTTRPNQLMSQRPHSEATLASLPPHPAVAYLRLVRRQSPTP